VNLGQGDEQRITVTMQVLQTVTGSIVMPVYTLRTLYKESDYIVVARAGQSIKIDARGDSKLIKTPLTVSSTIKGDGKNPVVNIYNWVSKDEENTFASGDNVLVFLNQSGHEIDTRAANAYTVVGESKGVKKLSGADLEVYLQQIEELAAITQKDKP